MPTYSASGFLPICYHPDQQYEKLQIKKTQSAFLPQLTSKTND